jgi:hypothetical protein
MTREWPHRTQTARRVAPRRDIRGRLMVLALIAIVPLIVDRIYDEQGNRAEHLATAFRQARELAQEGADKQNEYLATARTFLQVIARSYPAFGGSDEACGQFVAKLAPGPGPRPFRWPRRTGGSSVPAIRRPSASTSPTARTFRRRSGPAIRCQRVPVRTARATAVFVHGLSALRSGWFGRGRRQHDAGFELDQAEHQRAGGAIRLRRAYGGRQGYRHRAPARP